MDYFCPIDGKTYTKYGIAKALRRLGLDIKQFFDTYYRKPGQGVCPFCGKETKFKRLRYARFCNSKCAANHNKNSGKIHIRIKAGELDAKEVYSKMVKTRYENHTQQEINAKTEASILRRFGMSRKELSKVHLEKRFADMSESERKEFFDKATAKRNCYRYKTHKLNGKSVRVQGYEPQVLDVLKTIYDESTISVENEAIHYKDADGHDRRYYPDILIGKNLFEVKSSFTLKRHFKTNMAKLKAASDLGYRVFLVVWNVKTPIESKNELIEAISSQAHIGMGRFNDYPFIGVGVKLTDLEMLKTQSGL